ncbi:MAG: hypothetical protein QXP57_08850 [Nitrososphaerota archaeon]
MLKSVKNDWVDVKDIIVPVDRYWSRLAEEEKEFIIESIKKLGEKALLSHPILLTKAEGSKNMILADGFNRYDAARKAGLTRVYAAIEVYETEEEAVEVAKWKSLGENWIRGQRDPAQLIEKVKNWTSGMELNQAVKKLMEFGISRPHAYRIINIARDEELSRAVIEGRMSLRRAEEIIEERKAYEGGKVDIVSHVRQDIKFSLLEEGKPQKEAFSEKKAQIGLAKTCKTISEETSSKEAKIEEIEEEETESKVYKHFGVYKHLEIPTSIKSEMEKALEKLEEISLIEEEDKERLMEKAYNLLKDEDSVVQREAIRLWKKECIEDYTLYDLKNFIDKAREIVEERRMKKMERVEEHALKPRPRPEPREVKYVERPTPAPVPAPALEEKPILREKTEQEIIDECRRELHDILMAFGYPSSIAEFIAGSNELRDMYRELGVSGLVYFLSKLGAGKIQRMLEPVRKGMVGSLSRGLPGQEVALELKEKYESMREQIKKEFEELKEKKHVRLLEEWKNLIWSEAFMPREDVLILLHDSDFTLIAVKKRDIFSSEENMLRLQLVLASVRDSKPLGETLAMNLNINSRKVVVDYAGRRVEVAGLLCPSCRAMLTCHVCGSLVNCACGWPSTHVLPFSHNKYFAREVKEL